MTTKQNRQQTLHPYLIPLQEAFRKHAVPADAVAMAAYMKGHFPFHGLKMPLRRALQQEHAALHGKPALADLPQVVLSAFAQPERELHYAAVDLIKARAPKLGAEHLPLVEEMIITKSWWDTVDTLAVHVAGVILKNRPAVIEEWNDRWIGSRDLWLNRTAILFQNRWKQDTDRALLFANIDRHAGSKEFFLRKAIGWALRELGATDPEAVLAFVHTRKLSTLSEREALRKL